MQYLITYSTYGSRGRAVVACCDLMESRFGWGEGSGYAKGKKSGQTQLVADCNPQISMLVYKLETQKREAEMRRFADFFAIPISKR